MDVRVRRHALAAVRALLILAVPVACAAACAAQPLEDQLGGDDEGTDSSSDDAGTALPDKPTPPTRPTASSQPAASSTPMRADAGASPAPAVDAGCDAPGAHCATTPPPPPPNACPIGAACASGACTAKRCTSWGGAFEQIVGGACTVPSGVTGSCTCAPGFMPIPLTTIDFPAVAVLSVCVPPKMAANADFGGAFEIDEMVATGLGCRQKNPYTADCTCPPGFTDTKYRTLVTTAAGAPIPSFFHLCLEMTSQTVGGAFQLDDNMKCRHPNILTNACSCPPGFDLSSARVFDDQGAPVGNAGSTIGICNPPP